MNYAEIAVDFPDNSQRTYTYKVPDNLALELGDLVWVPFGTRILCGIVFYFTKEHDIDEEIIKYVISKISDGPYFDKRKMELIKNISDYYRVSFFSTASLFFPPNAFSKISTIFHSVNEEKIKDYKFSKIEKKLINIIKTNKKINKKQLIKKLGLPGKNLVEKMIRRNILSTENIWDKPRIGPVYHNRIILGISKNKAKQLVNELDSKKLRHKQLINWFLEDNYSDTKTKLYESFGYTATRWCLKEGIITIRKIKRIRDPLSKYFFQQEFAHTPSKEQSIAINKVIDSISSKKITNLNNKFLLHGITGSGKTEVYLQAIEECLKMNKNVIFLVPEISLTPQTLNRIASRFSGKVALLHSGLTSGERYDQWWRIRNNEYKIVLGSRSAIFAPLSNLGLIIIDEEHEWSYKQSDKAPRYDARKIAEIISNMYKCTLLFGSATPDVESFNKSIKSELKLLRLTSRFTKTKKNSLPLVEVVDMRNERRNGNFEMFSYAMLEEISRAISLDEKVILFLNRRGSASYVQCLNCGEIQKCARCEIPMTYHENISGYKSKLICHYCSSKRQPNMPCKNCNSIQVRRSNPGTEIVEKNIKNFFPAIDVIRWDSDTAKNRKNHADILDKFSELGSKILVGTQMIAKGLDISSVSFVGVISADTGLSLPDFRANERVFQILTQVIGRSGRGHKRGKAIVQTFNPENFAIQQAASQDYIGFYKSEIEYRSLYANPPFTKIIKLVYSSRDEQKGLLEVKKTFRIIRNAMELYGETSNVLLGPSPSYPFKLRNFYRWQIIIKGNSPHRIVDIVKPKNDWYIDVDPLMIS
ncbi:MAG: primosomal protein N' [Dehalococcoidia bacterium]